MMRGIGNDRAGRGARRALEIARLIGVWAAAASAALAAAGCGPEEAASARLDREIVIDGSCEDFDGAMLHWKDVPVSIGLLNDDEYLYVCLVTDDYALARRAMAAGLTARFAPADEKDRALEISYPAPRAPDGEGARPDFGPGECPGSEVREPPERAGGALDSLLAARLEEIEVRGPGDRETRRLRVSDLPDLPIRVSGGLNSFVYEVRVPLVKSERHPEAIGVPSGDPFLLTIETREIERPAGGGRPGRPGDSDGPDGFPGGGGPGEGGGGWPGGGRGGWPGGGGGFGGGPGGGPPGGGAGPGSADLSFELRVLLAGPPVE
jgi:hypothetical protein